MSKESLGSPGLQPATRQRGLSDGLRTWTMVRRKQSRGLGGSRVYKGAIRGRQNGNPGQSWIQRENWEFETHSRLRAVGFSITNQPSSSAPAPASVFVARVAIRVRHLHIAWVTSSTMGLIRFRGHHPKGGLMRRRRRARCRLSLSSPYGLVPGMDLRLHPCSVAPAACPERCGPRRPTRAGPSCNNATHGLTWPSLG